MGSLVGRAIKTHWRTIALVWVIAFIANIAVQFGVLMLVVDSDRYVADSMVPVLQIASLGTFGQLPIGARQVAALLITTTFWALAILGLLALLRSRYLRVRSDMTRDRV